MPKDVPDRDNKEIQYLLKWLSAGEKEGESTARADASKRFSTVLSALHREPKPPKAKASQKTSVLKP